MIEQTRGPGRRWFVRSATGGALSLVALGAQALFGASPAAAQGIHSSGCCLLVRAPSPWCPVTCADKGLALRCWGCNHDRCRCCECTDSSSCFLVFYASCSYTAGCCVDGD